MKPSSLTFKAGAGALNIVKSHGFDIASVGSIVGASGGAKWLVLSQLDKAILANLVPKMQPPVHLLGSSIGSWRFACYAQNNPLGAIQRFEDSYIEQSFSNRPDIVEITEKTSIALDTLLGENRASEILTSPLFRTHIMTVRSRGITATESKWLLGLGLTTAASLNLLSRKTLALFFERALFYDVRDPPPCFDATGFPLQQVPLRATNLKDAIAATGSIPLVLFGVPDIDGAAPGIYRDGGIIDYHHDLQHSADDRLTLYPHFYDRIVPGWFDKKLAWRRPDPAHIDRTILVSPSADFVARLPNAKIPDRTDFANYSQNERKRVWRECVSACTELADEFNEVISSERLAERLQTFD